MAKEMSRETIPIYYWSYWCSENHDNLEKAVIRKEYKITIYFYMLYVVCIQTPYSEDDDIKLKGESDFCEALSWNIRRLIWTVKFTYDFVICLVFRALDVYRNY